MEDDLHNAILANSLELVGYYLESGASLHGTPNLHCLESLVQGGIGISVDVTTVRVAYCDDDEEYEFSPLHSAVLNCYHNWENNINSLSILQALIDAGADPNLTCESAAVCNLSNVGWIKLDSLTPAGLAAVMKQNCGPRMGSFSIRQAVLDSAIELLVKAMKRRPKTVKKGNSLVPFRTWSSVFDSKAFCDIEFVCAEGKSLFAHRAVLAAASPYFRRFLEGPWGEYQQDGTWKTSNSYQVMKVVLKYMYTGSVDEKEVGEECLEVLSLAAEYELPGLFELLESICSKRISTKNLNETLFMADSLQSSVLKKAVDQYVRQNAYDILMQSGGYVSRALIETSPMTPTGLERPVKRPKRIHSY